MEVLVGRIGNKVVIIADLDAAERISYVMSQGAKVLLNPSDRYEMQGLAQKIQVDAESMRHEV